MKFASATIAIFMVLGACATPSADQNAEIDIAEDPRVGEELDRLCFTSGISGFGQTTRQSVVLRRGSKTYLVTTRNRCSDLDDALSLAVDSYSGCLSRGDQLIGFDSAFGGNAARLPSIPCFVDKIYEWDLDAEDTSAESFNRTENDNTVSVENDQPSLD